MTIARSDYFDEIIGAIKERVRVHHLMVSREEILRREAARPDDTGAWAEKTLARVLPELASSRYAEHLDAEAHSVHQIVAQIKPGSSRARLRQHAAMTPEQAYLKLS
jgi:hypothetical protein